MVLPNAAVPLPKIDPELDVVAGVPKRLPLKEACCSCPDVLAKGFCVWPCPNPKPEDVVVVLRFKAPNPKVVAGFANPKSDPVLGALEAALAKLKLFIWEGAEAKAPPLDVVLPNGLLVVEKTAPGDPKGLAVVAGDPKTDPPPNAGF